MVILRPLSNLFNLSLVTSQLWHLFLMSKESRNRETKTGCTNTSLTTKQYFHFSYKIYFHSLFAIHKGSEVALVAEPTAWVDKTWKLKVTSPEKKNTLYKAPLVLFFHSKRNTNHPSLYIPLMSVLSTLHTHITHILTYIHLTTFYHHDEPQLLQILCLKKTTQTSFNTKKVILKKRKKEKAEMSAGIMK